MSAIYKYEELYEESQRQRYREFVTSVSSISAFDDNIWVCDKRDTSHGLQLYYYKINFNKVAMKYREQVKFFAVLRIIDGVGVKAVVNNVRNVAKFIEFLGDTPINKVTPTTAAEFKHFLDLKGYAESYKSDYWMVLNMFFRKMNGFDGIKLKNPFTKNIFKYDRLIDSKYIPENVAKQLDYVFMQEDVPLVYRTIYWVLRLIPSRISEVLGMEIECVKPYDGHHVVIIPTWKQNGGYLEPIKRIIHIGDGEMGKYLLSLIQEQEKVSKCCQEFLSHKRQGLLFAYQQAIVLEGVQYLKNKYTVATNSTVEWNFKKICEKYKVKDENGEIYNLTSHQLRHNGVTDRLKHGFTLPQIAEMTAHHGTAMLYGSYAHLNLHPETLVDPIKFDKTAENPYVLFGSRILNMDAITEARLLKNLRSHRIPGGICADVTHCKSRMWDCISCEKFVPEVEQIQYFKEQSVAWQEKAVKFKTDKQLAENFAEISRKFANIVEKIGKDMMQ